MGAQWFEGSGTNYSVAAGRGHVSTSPLFRPALVDRRGRSLPRDPGQRRHELGDGRRDPARTDGWQVSRSSRRLAARVAGLSYGFLVFDDTGSEWTAPETGSASPLSQPVRLQSRPESIQCPLFHGSLGAEDRQPPECPGRTAPQTATAYPPPARPLFPGSPPAIRGPPERSASWRRSTASHSHAS